jgi:hypothetical protein
MVDAVLYPLSSDSRRTSCYFPREHEQEAAMTAINRQFHQSWRGPGPVIP